MADKYSSQYQNAYVSVPSVKIAPGEQSGEVKLLYAEHLGTAELATTDELYLAKIPAGARVIGGKIICPATGATGIFKVGYKANGVDNADDDAFAVNIDPGAAAVAADLAGAGIGKEFSVETIVSLIPTEVTASFTGKTLQVWLLYVTY